MEHGGVYIWYNTDDPDAIKLIKDLVNDNTDRRRFVGSTIYTGMESDTIAITSWSRLDKFPVSESDQGTPAGLHRRQPQALQPGGLLGASFSFSYTVPSLVECVAGAFVAPRPPYGEYLAPVLRLPASALG